VWDTEDAGGGRWYVDPDPEPDGLELDSLRFLFGGSLFEFAFEVEFECKASGWPFWFRCNDEEEEEDDPLRPLLFIADPQGPPTDPNLVSSCTSLSISYAVGLVGRLLLVGIVNPDVLVP
jgi:hypothetical protein